ncbi:MAG TPA: aromatic hydrocarbon degradation protein, partial [Ferruginibacter sp.]|nr:aromatic hydrocarbon degradation protein [Ferruginibacter sp.]
IPIVYYNSHTVLTESDTSASRLNGFNTATYTDDFKTSGAGINVRLGGIYRPTEYIRLGLAIQTPTFMFLNDKHNSYLYTQIENDTGKLITNEVSSNLFTNGSPGENKYYQNAPWKAVISASYVFREVENVKRQRAFISADIEYVNHRGSRFNSYAEEPTEEEKNYYKALNQVVKNEFKGTFNFRIGGEIKFNTIMARLGAAYYGNPYKDKDLKANRVLLSGGLGYRNKGFFVDLTYVHQVSKDVNFPYRLEDRANTFASIKQTQGNLVASVGFKF